MDPQQRDGKRRRSIRLPSFDYASAGAYFVTVVAAERACLFGDVIGEAMRLSDIGRIVEEEWQRTAAMRANVEGDAFVVMPDHLHGILWPLDEAVVASDAGTARRAPTDRVPARFGKPVTGSLSVVVGAFKSAVTRRTRTEVGPSDIGVWQRGFYERVIRDEGELQRIREYIVANPHLWAEDEENPARTV